MDPNQKPRSYVLCPSTRRGKMIYDHQEAHRVRRRMEARNGVKFKVYKCETCKMWHITSQPDKDDFRRELLDD